MKKLIVAILDRSARGATLFALTLVPAAWAASPMVAHPPADFAGTGRSALLWQNTNGAAALWLMNGTTLQSAVQFGPYTGWSVLSGDADFNADGKSDLLWTHTNGAAAVWLMNGITQVSAASFGPYPGWSVVSGNHDFNGDGKSDLLWKNTDGSVAIWLMNGTTVLSQASFGPYPGWSIVSGDNDFNGDGKSDLLWKNSNGAAALWLMDGTTQTSATQFGPYTGWSILSGSSDFNGDGKTDLLWQNSNGAAALWLMNGLTQTSAAQFGPYTGWTVVPGRRDFNGDGKSDLLWSNSNGAAAVWLMNGLTQTSAASFGPFTGWSITGGIGDYNGDGKTDLLWSNSDGSAAVWLMNGTSQTSAAGFGPYFGWSIMTGTSGPSLHFGAVATADLGIGASLNGAIPFPADNAWNTDISGAPVDPTSAALIASIGTGGSLFPDFGSGTYQGTLIGIPYVVVSGSQTKVAIHFTDYGDESDPGPYPVPPEAPVEGALADGSGGGDRHVLVIDRDNNRLYELGQAYKQADNSWNAAVGAVFHLDSNNVRPGGQPGWTSADAAGLPIFPGLVRYDEAASGVIAHALRFTVNSSRKAYVPPATHWASSNTSTSLPPMGMRVRLKASYVIPSGFSTESKAILQALKTYGMLVADNGSNWYISGAPDSRWNNDSLHSELGSVKGSNFEVVRMDGLVTP